MHRPYSFLENETRKVLWNLHRDHTTSARKPDLILIIKKKESYHLVDFAFPTDHISIIMMLCRLYGFLWLSITTYPDRPSLPDGFLDCILYPYRAVLDKF